MIAGPCAGGAVYSPAITDFIIMTEKISQMFITGPEIIKTVTGEDVTFRRARRRDDARDQSGVAHLVAADEDELNDLDARAAFVHSAEQSRGSARASIATTIRIASVHALDDLVPDSPNKPYDMRDGRSSGVVDYGDFFEIQPLYAQNIICGFGRDRRPQPSASSPTSRTCSPGVLDIDSSIKAARFVRFCDAFNIPLVTFVDVPGFLPGTDQEYGGIIMHGAKLLYAFAEATVPKITVITRKAYGGAYDVMASKHIRADVNLAWPTAEIAVMGAEGAVKTIFRREIAAAGDPERQDARACRRVHRALRQPVHRGAARLRRRRHRGAPDAQRDRDARSKCSQNKRVERPKRKHGNIPL